MHMPFVVHKIVSGRHKSCSNTVQLAQFCLLCNHEHPCVMSFGSHRCWSTKALMLCCWSQVFLLLIAFAAVPWMLIPKPYVLKKRHEARMAQVISSPDKLSNLDLQQCSVHSLKYSLGVGCLGFV